MKSGTRISVCASALFVAFAVLADTAMADDVGRVTESSMNYLPTPECSQHRAEAHAGKTVEEQQQAMGHGGSPRKGRLIMPVLIGRST